MSSRATPMRPRNPEGLMLVGLLFIAQSGGREERQAAVHQQRAAGHLLVFGIAQMSDFVGDFFGSNEVSNRNAGLRFFARAGIPLPNLAAQSGIDISRGDFVNENIVR